MKRPHSQAALLRDLKRRVNASTLGSEPFAGALKVIGDTAWTILQLRGIDWPAIYVPPKYMYRSYSYLATTTGLELCHIRQPRNEKPAVVMTPYLKGVQKAAVKTLKQFERTCTWIMDKFSEALDTKGLNDRSLLRCLQGKARFEQLTNERFDLIDRWKANSEGKPKTEMSSLVERHGHVICYREHSYRSTKEAVVAVEADTKPIAPDHDMVVSLCEAAFAGAGDPEAEAEVNRYINSKDHREAVKEAEGKVTDPTLLPRKERIIRMVTKAERALFSAPDPLPAENLHKILGVSRNYLYKLMRGKKKDGSYAKADIRAALRARLYEISPQRKPRRKGHQPAPEETAIANPKYPCPPDCRCIRHN